MKKLFILFLGILATTGSWANGNSFIFNENGIDFAVYQDGQFDFALNNQSHKRTNVHVAINRPGLNISFNAGYNYDAYVQYDTYGAVIQIMDVPVFYDGFGRITRAGNVLVSYNGFGRIGAIGGLYAQYDPYGAYIGSRGYINAHNRRYVSNSMHDYFRPPMATRCIVYNRPYRLNYTPNRYSYKTYRTNYHKGYYSNVYQKRTYARPFNTPPGHYKNGYRKNTVSKNKKKHSAQTKNRYENPLRSSRSNKQVRAVNSRSYDQSNAVRNSRYNNGRNIQPKGTMNRPSGTITNKRISTPNSSGRYNKITNHASRSTNRNATVSTRQNSRKNTGYSTSRNR